MHLPALLALALSLALGPARAAAAPQFQLSRSVSGAAIGDGNLRFGAALAVVPAAGEDGDATLLVGAPLDDATSAGGSAHVIDPATGAVLLAIPNPSAASRDRFGAAVAVVRRAAGGVDLVVGAPLDDTAADDGGAVHVFDGVTGVLRRTLVNDTPGAQFGFAIAALGADRIAVGAPFEDGGEGAVVLVDTDAGAVIRVLQAPTPGSFFGAALAAANGDVLVGAPAEGTEAENAGRAYLMSAETGAVLQTYRKAAPAAGDLFGAAAAAAGSLVLVGAPLDDAAGPDTGAVYLLDAATGEFADVVHPPGPAGKEGFGAALAAADGSLLVGAPGAEEASTGQGAAYLFDVLTGTLVQELPNPRAAVGERFGLAVALDDAPAGLGVFVGAPGPELPIGDDSGPEHIGRVHYFTFCGTSCPGGCGDGIIEGTTVPTGPVAAVTAAGGSGDDCCEARLMSGCSDDACTACVCGFDEFCCLAVWDDICVARTALDCPQHCACAAGSGGDECASPVVVLATPFSHEADTTAATTAAADPVQSCARNGPAQNERSVWFYFTAPTLGTVIADTFGSDYDTVVAAYTGTCDALTEEVACNDDAGGAQSRVEFRARPGGKYLVEVTAAGAGAGGTLRFHLAFQPLEECDDANGVDGDGCDGNCTVSGCGNGVRAGFEQCDDGNRGAGDGCDGDCLIENSCGGDALLAGAPTMAGEVAGACLPCDPGTQDCLPCDPGAQACLVAACECGMTVGQCCDDGNPTTVNDTCDADARCRGVCDDGFDCTIDVFDADVGCRHVPDDTRCAPPERCAAEDRYRPSGCGPDLLPNVCHDARQCDDGNPCSIDDCVAKRCVHTAMPTGSPCPDADDCTGTCQTCSGCFVYTWPCCTGSARTRCALRKPPAAGTACDDRNACTLTDRCMGGVCVGQDPLVCSAPDQCHEGATCDPATGLCSTPKPDGESCDDGDPCTASDVCQGGACAAGMLRDCDDGNGCTLDECDATGSCTHAVIPGCQPCETAGQCDQGNPCADMACDEGRCAPVAVADGRSCADADRCDGAETCQGGVCTAGSPLVCDDGNPCTIDACDPPSGCGATPVADGTTCADADPCDGVETCEGGACMPGTPPGCFDGVDCAFEGALEVGPCIGETLPPGVGTKLDQAKTRIEEARTASGRKGRRRIGAAIRALNKAAKLVRKAQRRDQITAGCAAELRAAILDDIRARAQDLRRNLATCG